MAVQISANTADFGKGINQANAQLKSFETSVKQIGAVLGVTFGVREISGFILEANRLVGTFDGVKRAFDNLPNSELLMNKLKESTHGTVNELNLMQQALRAKNFGISVKDLGTYLEFAAIRAQQTGESIDYMVNSIILGLGRGSIKILDNLQVNIAKIKETVKETGVTLQEAFRQQVLEQMNTLGGYAKTSKTEVELLESALYNLRLEVSRKAESGGFISFLTEQVKSLSFLIKGGLDPSKAAALQALDDLEQKAIKSAENITKAISGSTEEQTKALQSQIAEMERIIALRKEEISQFQKTVDNGKGFGFPGFQQENPEGFKRFLELQKQYGVQARNIFEQEVSNARKTIGDMMKSNSVRIRTLELLKEYTTNVELSGAETVKQLGLIEKVLQDIENEKAFQQAALDPKSLAESNRELQKLNRELERLQNLGIEKKDVKALAKFNPPKEISTQDIEFGPSVADQFNTLKAALSQIGEAFNAVENTATDAFKKIEEGIEAVAAKMIDIGPLIASGIADIADAFGQAAAGGENFGKNFIKALARFAQQFGSLLIATGIGQLALQSGNPALMIAGGAALIAAGAAINQLMANKPSLSGRGSSGATTNRGQAFSRQSIVIEGDFRIEGRDLVYAYDKNKALDIKRTS